MTNKLKIIFMGTPEFSVTSLEALKDRTEILAVITQPDRPRGRGKKVLPSPVKTWAIENKIEVLQPEKIKTEEFTNQLADLKPDLIIVVAFGQILSQKILDLPKFGCINVHASLLPKYRGAAPIEWSIINGETKTGVTTMMMNAGLDTGDMLVRREVEISENMILPELREKLQIAGADALIETIDRIVDGSLTRQVQDDSLSSYAPMLTKETGLIDWNKSAREIHNLVRGLYGGAYTIIDGQKFKIWKSRINSECGMQNAELNFNDKLFVNTGDGVIEILEIQAPNSKKLSTADFLRGHKDFKIVL
ncbi:MAG: methionyl-tRNA formyltransferase [Selenomonadaceae bacterium]|nr:methionyl-tRNA formyltransferase [Selenomonadaceae bacterium]